VVTEEKSRRDAILAATVEEVVKRGIDGASIQRIAAAAGVSAGLVMYHFRSKEELINSAWVASVKHFYSRNVETGGGQAGLRHMENGFRVQFVDRDEDTPPWNLWLELWAKAARSPKLRAMHLERIAEIRRSYTQRLRAALESGEMRPDLDPELAGDLLHTLIYGLAVKVTLDSELISPERALQIGKLAVSLLRSGQPADDPGAAPA